MENGFRGLHPFILLAYYIASAILIMIYNHPVFLLTTLILLILVNISHDKGKTLKQWSIPLLVMGMIFALMNPLFVSRGTHILFYLGHRQITLEALMYGVYMSLMLMSIIVLFVSFNFVLNGNKFLYVFSKIVPRTAFLLMLTIRFVPLLKGRYDEIAAVQRVRGMTMSEGNLRNRARNGMSMIQTLLTWSLEEAIQTADSMQSRGYGLGKKSSYVLYQMERKDWWTAFIFAILLSVCLFGSAYGYGKIIIYPELGTLQFYLLDWLSFVSLCCLVAYPLIIEGIEHIRWTLYK